MSDNTATQASPATLDAPGAEPAERRNRLIGAGLMVLSVICFTGLDSTMKMLVANHDLWMLAWARNLAQVGLLVALLPLLGPRRVLTARRPWLQVARGACLAASTIAILMSLERMTLTQTYVAMLSAPLVATALAGPLLREWATPMQWLCIAGGFIGVIVALDPTTPALGAYLLYAAGMALSLGTNHCLTRLGARTDGAYTQLFYIAFFAFLLLSPILLVTPASLPFEAWGWVALAGAFGTAAHFLMILAFGYAPPSVVSPMLYTQIVWAALVGWLVFAEWPTPWTVLGSAIVVATGIVLLRNRGRG